MFTLDWIMFTGYAVFGFALIRRQENFQDFYLPFISILLISAYQCAIVITPLWETALSDFCVKSICYLFIVAFFYVNRSLLPIGSSLNIVGNFLNQLVMAANDFRTPLAANFISGQSPEYISYVPMHAKTNLPFLADWMRIGREHQLFSFGDALLTLSFYLMAFELLRLQSSKPSV